jgi:hypothetical protein
MSMYRQLVRLSLASVLYQLTALQVQTVRQ